MIEDVKEFAKSMEERTSRSKTKQTGKAEKEEDHDESEEEDEDVVPRKRPVSPAFPSAPPLDVLWIETNLVLIFCATGKCSQQHSRFLTRPER